MNTVFSTFQLDWFAYFFLNWIMLKGFVGLKISIIIPVFNVENYLPKMINSILSQQIRDFEIILIDDGSTDSSGKICDNYSKQHKNIHVIHQYNRGASFARNKGITLAKGKYIFFLDADDELRKNYFHNMMYSFDTTKSDMVCCLYSSNDKKEKHDSRYVIQQPKLMMYGLISKRRTKKYSGYLWCKAFRGDIIRNNNILFDETVGMWEDVLFVENYLCYCRQVTFLNDDLYLYRDRRGSITRLGMNMDRAVQSMVIVFKRIMSLNRAPLSVRLRAFCCYSKILFKKVINKVCVN